MKLSIGIVGLPNVGKSTFFRALTQKDITIANYPFATIDPNVGIVSVPDERLARLTEISKSKKTIPAIVEFWDIAGLVKNAHAGEGLGNQFLANIREVNVIVHVVRCFPSTDIIHVEESIDPVRDIEIIHAELILKDLETVEKRIGNTERDTRSNDAKVAKSAKEEMASLDEARASLSAGTLLTEKKDDPFIRNLQLLTAKPHIYLLNGTEGDVPDAVRERFARTEEAYVVADLGAEKPNLSGLIRNAYEVLNCVSFFTTGEEETRAWTIQKGTKAPQAAGVIHTDFEKTFIKAEVIPYDEFVTAGGWSAAKAKGKIRLEGKEYEVQDGDILVIKHG